MLIKQSDSEAVLGMMTSKHGCELGKNSIVTAASRPQLIDRRQACEQVQWRPL